MKTYSLTEVAAMTLPPEWRNPTRWLRERLCRGDITGYKVGHAWRMTRDDVDAMITRYRIRDRKPAQKTLALTGTSRRRLKAVAK